MNVSDSIHPRPVWARRQQRLAGKPLPAPTDIEKHDAILVLRDAHLHDWMPTGRELHEEALRILDNA